MEDFKFYSFDSLKDLEILNIAADQFHNKYATVSDKGIVVIHEDMKDNLQIHFIDYFLKKNVNVTAIHISESGILWVGTKEGRLFYGQITDATSKISFSEFPLGQKFERINVINSDSLKSIWIGTNHQLYQINLNSKLVLPIRLQKDNKDGSIIIYDIKWKNNSLWIATGEGLFKFNSNDHILQGSFYHSEKDPNSLSNNTVNSLFVDSNDQLWVGTGKYLNLFYTSNIFHNITHETGNKNSINSNIIFSILGNNDDLWIGTSGGGINLLKNQQFYSFTRDSHQLPSNVCFTLLQDTDKIWAGTKEGLVILSGIRKDYPEIEANTIIHDPKDTLSLSSNFIRHLYKDLKGNIWLCTEGGGLNLFNGNIKKKDYSFLHYHHQFEDPTSISSDKVKYITQINDNSYWVGTNKGLNILSFKKQDLSKPVFSQLHIRDSVVLSNEVIYNILKDKDSGVWIGTTKGLYFYNLQEPGLRLIKEKNNLNNVIYGLLKDHQNNIWFSTNKGLSHYDRVTGIFTHYNQGDGISSEEFDLNASYKDPSGLMYFGGIHGITYFNPKEVIYTPKESKLYIDNIQITNTEKNILETQQIKKDQSVNILSKQFPFYVNFSDINLNFFKNTEFAYRLKPDDNQWNHIHNKRQIQFINLTPGDYTLEIQEVTKGIIWNETKPLAFSITVIPLWWQSQLAYYLYLIFFLSLVYLIYRFTLNKKLEHQENLRLLELDKMKTKLYGNITHELRTPLTMIMGMTNYIKQKINLEEQKNLKLKFEILTRNSKKLLYLINQMLDLSKIESGKMDLRPIHTDIIPFIKIIPDSFRSLASHKNIKLTLYNENDKINMDFDPEKISVIISNLLSNAIKFTPEKGSIILHTKRVIKNSNPLFVLKVKDNGIGIKEENQKHIFDRFYQVDNPNFGGTGIGLSLTKELVLLMNGEISVKSQMGKGTKFRIEIPITNNAEKPEKDNLNFFPLMSEIEDQNIDEISNDRHEDLPQILIIEDNKDVAHFIASGLINQYEISFAQNGEQGVLKAFEKIPDLVITDLMMPKKDGFEVCEILKKDERTSHIPVIMLTARAFEKDKIKGFAHGTDAYLTKPFNQNELLIRIEQLILLRKKMQKKYQKTGFLLNNETPKEENFINKCISAIQQNLGDENFKSSDLAFAVHLSESQLYRKLKAVTNLSTAVFIRDIRLHSAKEILQKTDKNISEVAYSCGFSNPDWFSRSFKEKFGYTPSNFRQKP